MCMPESVRRGVESDEVLGSKYDNASRVEAEEFDVETLSAAQHSTLRRRRVFDAARHSLHDVS